MVPSALKAAAAFALAAACVHAQAAELKLAIATDVTSMDPQYANIAGNVQVSRHMFESLADLDADGRLVPRLAESWRRTEASVWEFKLRPNVKFHDGSTLTAEDVVYSVGRPATLTSSPATLNGFLKDITKAEALDANTVRFTTATPLAVLPNYLAMVPIVSKHATQGLKPEDFETGKGMVGTGPYRFGKFLRSDRIEMTRNEAYWGKKPHFDKVTIRIMPNNPARTAALLSGEVDAIAVVPTADVARIKQNPNITFYTKPLARHTFWTLNQASDALPQAFDHDGKPLTSNPFKDVRVRKAFSKAIDREAIGSRVMDGLGVPTQNPVPATMFGYNPDLAPEKYDLEGAKKLMAEAGLPNCFKLSIFARSDSHPTDSAQAQAVGQMLSRLGCKVSVEVVPTSVFFTRGNKLELPMLLLATGVDGGDLGVTLEYLFSNPTNNPFRKVNMQTYDSPAFWKPLREALALNDEQVRERKYRDTTRVLRDEVGVIPTELMVGTWAARKGVVLTPRVDERTYAFEASGN
ncbi:ABC transporter substrate-binding protein [Ramlibacter sp. G-1-2-2]|uniref:ABC transporter substrate-binding protein n=1 Tax=Ramlibacter agri TaxID=2728837 RepID=A0A848H8G8_9BURK|nr:ABC transporter substrate-binding protein [Ramlibacter agri]NML47075.1 ABC transporter substrate-binding protein [Ramlibacter agri]